MRAFKTGGCYKAVLLFGIFDDSEFASAFLGLSIPNRVMSCDADCFLETLLFSHEVVWFAGACLGLRVPDRVVSADADLFSETCFLVVWFLWDAFAFFSGGIVDCDVSNFAEEITWLSSEFIFCILLAMIK